MPKYGGVAHCSKCGVFEWWIIKPDQNAPVFGRWDDLAHNCVRFSITNGIGHAIVKCPSCGQTLETTDSQ